jgi:hypothetical protein
MIASSRADIARVLASLPKQASNHVILGLPPELQQTSTNKTFHSMSPPPKQNWDFFYLQSPLLDDSA